MEWVEFGEGRLKREMQSAVRARYAPCPSEVGTRDNYHLANAFGLLAYVRYEFLTMSPMYLVIKSLL